MRTHLVPALVLLLITACAGEAGPTTTAPAPSTTTTTSPSTTTTTATPTTTTTSSTTTTTSTTSTTSTTVPAGSSTSAPSTTVAALPDNARSYAAATFEAWAAGEESHLDRLTTEEAMATLTGSQLDRSAGWQFQRCGAAAGSAYCSWQSEDGTTLTFRVASRAASGAEEEAVTEVRVEA